MNRVINIILQFSLQLLVGQNEVSLHNHFLMIPDVPIILLYMCKRILYLYKE